MTNSTTKVKLDNGLTIHLKEIHTAPIISHWVWYRVGSRDEIPGKTGISHWVEHMQFKGTPQFPAGKLDKAISRDGGFWNAFTYLDWTAFFQTMPADKIDLALKLEADRMSNCLYEPDEVESERTVIISELEGGENEPLVRLGKAVQRASFASHPYHYEVIGEVEDLRAISRDDLYGHYRTYYQPNNAQVCISGDFDTADMIEQITRLYQAKPSTADVPHPARPEAAPNSEQRLEVKGPGETTFIQVAYRAPAASDPDFFNLTVLDSLLTGPSSLNMFGGGGISNKTSRMYQALVEKELVVGVDGGLSATIDPYLYEITLTVHPERSPEEALAAMDREMMRVLNEKVSEEDVKRAIKQARALFAYGTENITNQGFWLGYADMFDSYNWFEAYIERLETITPADVLSAAQRYLSPARRVVGLYIPDNNSKEGLE
ncbi:MAG: insulinase family protein [Anaerolineae bacterium]|nr:insulinase family protein [Anaerolineae bacterium]